MKISVNPLVNGLTSIKDFIGHRSNKTKSIHIRITGKDVDELDHLTRLIYPYNQTGVFKASLSLMYELLNEYTEGSTFYIKRKGKEIEEYKIFESNMKK